MSSYKNTIKLTFYSFAGILLLISNSCVQKAETAENVLINKSENLSEAGSVLCAEGFYFAGRTEVGISRIDPPVFKRGDDVYLVLTNVGKFKKDNEGYNHLELHMTIHSQVGERIIQHRNILREDGKMKLDNDVAKKPNARYKTNIDSEPGKYKFTVTVVDLITNDSTYVESEYFLE